MSNNKLNCDTEIQGLQDLINKQQRRISIFQNTQDLTEQNAAKVNDLIDKANASVFCGPGSDCYDNKKSDELLKIYESKQVNKKTAPEQLDSARKNYYTFTYGEPGFIKKETEVLTNRVDKQIAVKTKDHKIQVEEINEFINSYDSAVRYKANLLLYLSKLYNENFELSQEIKDSIASLRTADRKVWYEDDQIKTVDLWVTVMKGLYWLVFAIFAGLFLWNKMWQINRPFKFVYCFVLLFLVLWLYIGDYLVIKLIQLIQKLINKLPKNVYYDAKNM